jgi:hypothetical protein
MAKRLTDNTKWDDPWFAELPSKYKLFYLYLLDECDHAGIWKVNFRKAQFMIGEHLEPSEVIRYMGDRIRKVDDAYWFVTKFIRFQYGMLRNDRMSQSALSILEKHGLTDVISENYEGAKKGHVSPIDGVKDKDKDKDRYKVISKEGGLGGVSIPTLEDCKATAQMSGFTAEQGEAYYHFRNKDGWMTARGKEGNLFPIANWRSDMTTCINKGYIDRDPKSKPVDHYAGMKPL